MDVPPTQKFIDWLTHVWPVISGLFLTMVMVTRLWWSDKVETKKRITSLEILAEHTASKNDLRKCRDEVRTVDEHNLEKIQQLIHEGNKENQEQHADLMKHIIEIHSRLHK